MALDRNYFNSIRLDPIKRKYYDISAVDNILVDIRKQAELINHRYEDCFEKGQALSQEVISLRKDLDDMTARAKTAENRVAALQLELQNTQNSQGKHLSQTTSAENVQTTININKISQMYNSMRTILSSGIDSLDQQWQAFLNGSPELKPPADISDKIEKIASALQEINNELH